MRNTKRFYCGVMNLKVSSENPFHTALQVSPSGWCCCEHFLSSLSPTSLREQSAPKPLNARNRLSQSVLFQAAPSWERCCSRMLSTFFSPQWALRNFLTSQAHTVTWNPANSHVICLLLITEMFKLGAFTVSVCTTSGDYFCSALKSVSSTPLYSDAQPLTEGGQACSF